MNGLSVPILVKSFLCRSFFSLGSLYIVCVYYVCVGWFVLDKFVLLFCVFKQFFVWDKQFYLISFKTINFSFVALYIQHRMMMTDGTRRCDKYFNLKKTFVLAKTIFNITKFALLQHTLRLNK